jgi:4-hydroxybenzoate polyprenyltransferase
MKQLNIFIELTRLNRPTGFMLLFWPCSWGLVFAYQYNQDIKKLLYFLLLFFLGSVLMRSAGCIVNDIVDKNIDTKVKRTKNRPLASGKISVKNSALYVFILCIFAFIILIQFNKLTILLGLASMFLAFSYPFMKRITYWPQLFLGLTFNWGIIMAWTSMGNVISTEIMLLYLAAIFWTLGYDTIYGAQDITEDEIIGVKSTSIKFKDNIKMFVTLCYLISSIILIFLFHNQMHLYYFIVPMFLFIVSLGYQIKIFDTKIPIKCLHAFKINNFSGVFLFLSILGSAN